ncbi:Capsular polysaccharide export system protein KpsC [Acidisarcina polymorpha]|uniref:Capsular polysaccharide export system protein KpsC n=2 Tax=Acidisarcina polymorpha TaxID=2211140 RepID=A0A2Z5FWJ4_9BACT|nr:Capsular polysaccharide export system protein KpsC [Acidisarcina polymorpha]
MSGQSSSADSTGTSGSGTTLSSGASQSADPTAASGLSTTENPSTNTSFANGGTSLANGAPAPLTADQIFAVLQEEPDTIVELKSLVSDLAQQQGTPIQPDSITDEMLYSKIASSPELRANITTFLRARGYVTDNDLQSFAAGSDGNDAFSFQVPQTPDQQFAGGSLPLNVLPEAISGVPSQASRAGTTQSNLARPVTSARTNPPREPQVLHRPTPYNLLSLRDLYTQLPEQNGQLKRFGSEVFLRRSGYSSNQIAPNARETPLDVPAGPAYVIGPGDSLTITLWGGISQTVTRVIDREGKLALPEAGVVQVAGLSLEHAQAVIADTLKRQFRDAQVAVTVARLRSIRIFVVGDVQRPGAYDISSLSTPLNALYAAGGPTSTGSLRLLRHYRGKELIGEIDLYDFLLHGVQNEEHLESGDTVLVPPTGPQVSVYGAVKRPALYELKGETTLAAMLDDAGGVTVTAELGHIVIDRVVANQQRETVSLDLPAGSSPDSARAAIVAFPVHDGDRIHVSRILPYSQRLVYVEGHVVRPGRMPYHDGMQLSEVLHSYQDMLPEPADRGEIIRLVPPDLHPETINFNVPETLIGNNNLTLQPFDTIRILGRYEADAPQVTVGGEVLRPGTYALSEGLTAAQLVRMAGGFKRDALLTDADLTSYQVVGGTKVVSDRASIRIGDAVDHNDRSADAPLKPGDVLTIHQLTGWNDIGSSITIEGEVSHPGVYGFQQGERLSSILRRAGGFRDTSYPAGAVLVRDDVRKLEEKSREELIRQIETSSTAARMRPTIASGDQSATLQLIQEEQTEVLSRLRSQPPTGRLVIHIDSDISSWENTPADIEVRSGDVLRIPKRPGFVLVSGQVYNASAITFSPGKTAAWYLRRAGGANQIANKGDIFVIRANGSVVGRGSGSWFDHDVLSTQLEPGDVVVVPQKIIGASVFWRNLLTVAQLSSSIAITASVAGLL